MQTHFNYSGCLKPDLDDIEEEDIFEDYHLDEDEREDDEHDEPPSLELYGMSLRDFM